MKGTSVAIAFRLKFVSSAINMVAWLRLLSLCTGDIHLDHAVYLCSLIIYSFEHQRLFNNACQASSLATYL